MNGFRRLVALMGGLTMVLAASAAILAAGNWGGDRLRLVVDALGATIETDCASGSIHGPIEVDANGSFVASGYFVEHKGGAQPADAASAAGPARFSGRIEGDTLRLSIVPAGATKAQAFTLRRGVAVKLVRCL